MAITNDAKLALAELQEELAVIESWHDADGGKNPVVRRIMIRSMFAAMEALAEAMMRTAVSPVAKQVSLGACGDDRHQGFFEICALMNQTYQLDDEGDVILQDARPRFRQKVLFAVKMLARAMGNSIDPKLVDGWASFGHAVKVRNRITHPKTLKDLEITDGDYRVSIEALKWLVACNRLASHKSNASQ